MTDHLEAVDRSLAATALVEAYLRRDNDTLAALLHGLDADEARKLLLLCVGKWGDHVRDLFGAEQALQLFAEWRKHLLTMSADLG